MFKRFLLKIAKPAAILKRAFCLYDKKPHFNSDYLELVKGSLSVSYFGI